MPAAGIGSRMQSKLPKQYLKLANGKTILDTTIQSLLASDAISNVLVVLHPKDSFWKQSAFVDAKNVKVCVGGAERVDSVLAGLTHLKSHIEDDEWVMVHDAARPCVDANDVDGLYQIIEGSEAIGGLLALPVHETVKASTEFQTVMKTVDRSELWLAQTPQIFPFAALQTSMLEAKTDGVKITDESSAMEHAGFKPTLVVGSRKNIKITTPEDIELANLYG